MPSSTSFLDYVSVPPQVSLTPYSALHYKYLNISDEGFLSAARAVSPEAMLEYQSAIGNAYTAMLYGKPVAVFGSAALWPGVEEAWSLLGDDSRTYAKTLTKIAVQFIDFRVISADLHRVQMTVRCDDMRAVRWAKDALGFKIEGMMERYGTDGSDFYMMSRV